MHRRTIQMIAVIMLYTLLLTGCTSQASNIGHAKESGTENVVDTGFTVTAIGSYDSADTAVVMQIDEDNHSVTFMNMDAGKKYTLYYDGTTYIKDKYGSAMSISQIVAGDVVDVCFLKGKKQMASMQLSPEAWVYEDIDNYDLGGANKTAAIGSNTYSMPDDAVILSDGQQVEMMDVVKQDRVTIRGVGHTIYSVNIEKGHGYLRLQNEQALLGGWIEVGTSVIREITEDMLLVVPEGKYQVLLSNGNTSCTKEIAIERNKEVVLDLADVEIAQDKTGTILLEVTPDTARVSIDGETVDISAPVELAYGIHKVHLEAAGYDSLTKYLQVGSEYAKISFTLEEQEEETDSISENTVERTPSEDEILGKDTISQNSVSENSVDSNKKKDSVSQNTVSTSASKKVYIDAPEDVEVYLDDNYVGIAPVKFKKVAGNHTITLRKTGYQTKSYTIYLYDDKEDITYSFSELEKIVSAEEDTKNTTSSQSTSTGSTSADTTSTGSTSTDSTSTGSTSTDSTSTGSTSTDSTSTGSTSTDSTSTGSSSGDGTSTGAAGGDGGSVSGNDVDVSSTSVHSRQTGRMVH